ncbi:unannotated protein [freshwater metagenome]|uniref:Unannotated protein n=1 Tax=freshwater metagenome TaxID=449393 RepID=A0A6J6IPA6_9ZZZZ
MGHSTVHTTFGDGRFDSALDRVDRVTHVKPLLEVKFRRPSDLTVDNTVRNEILDKLVRDSFEIRCRLHDGQGYRERGEVIDEVP